MARPASGANLSIPQLEQILQKRRSERQQLEKERSRLQRRLGELEAKIRALGGGGSRGRIGTGRVRNEKSLNEMIVAVLSRTGKPMGVGDIEQAVRSAGYRSNSDSFRSIVNQALIKDKRFGAASRGMYQLKK